MSFSFSFHAHSRHDAIEALNLQHAPEPVKDFIRANLHNMRHDGIVHVSAVGHLCDGPSSYEPGTCTINITPLITATLPKSDTPEPQAA